MERLIQNINNYQDKGMSPVRSKRKAGDKPAFCANAPAGESEVSSMPNVTNDSAVRVPMKYSKLGIMDLPYGLKAHCYKMANGQQVVIVPKEGSTVLKSYVNTGSLNEPDNLRGISHYIEHNLFNGSQGLEAGEFFKATDRIGAETNASTGMAATDYYISSNLLNETDFEEEMRLHASMIETPTFAVNMLEKEKGIVNSEINMITSDPGTIAFNTTLKNLFNIKTTSEDLVGGTTDNITNLTREDVVDYFNKNYYPANIVTVITGEVKPDEAMKTVSKYFNSTKMPPAGRHYEELTPIEKPIRQDVISDKATSAQIALGFVGSKNNDLKAEIYMLALSYLMFESGEAIEEFKPLNAEASSFQEKILAKPDANNINLAFAEVSEENSEKALNVIYNRIQKLQNYPINEDQLKTVKKYLNKAYVEGFESSYMVNNLIGRSLLNGSFKDISKFKEIIDSMTVQDLMDAAKKYYDLNKVAITVVHPENATEDSIISRYNQNLAPSFTGNHKQAIDIGKVKQYGLNNNYRVAVYDSRFPTIDAVVLKRAEQPIYPHNPAVYSVLNEILANGTMLKTREEFNKQNEVNGVGVAVNVDSEGIHSALSSDVVDYDKAFEAYRELLEHPRFTQEEFDNAVKVVRDFLLREEKSPMNKLAPELNPLRAYPSEEILEGLNSLSLDEVKNVYAQLYNNSHAIASVAAPVSTNAELNNTILGSFAALDAVHPYKVVGNDTFKPVTETKVLTDTDNKNQAQIHMAYKFLDNGNIHDRVSFDLMNKILGGGPSSRLFSDLRESQKLAYSVRSGVVKTNNTGSIILTIGTTTDNKVTGEKSYDNLQKSIDGFISNIQRMKTEKVSEEELEKAKLSLKNEILSTNEITSAKNISLMVGASNWYGPTYKNQYLDMIDNITVDDIYNAANYVFSGKPLYSIVATQDTLDANKEYLDSLL